MVCFEARGIGFHLFELRRKNGFVSHFSTGAPWPSKRSVISACASAPSRSRFSAEPHASASGRDARTNDAVCVYGLARVRGGGLAENAQVVEEKGEVRGAKVEIALMAAAGAVRCGQNTKSTPTRFSGPGVLRVLRKRTTTSEAEPGDEGAGAARKVSGGEPLGARERAVIWQLVRVDRSESACKDRPISSAVAQRHPSIRCTRVGHQRPVEDVDELAPDIEVIFAFLADAEMAADVRVFRRTARATEIAV